MSPLEDASGSHSEERSQPARSSMSLPDRQLRSTCLSSSPSAGSRSEATGQGRPLALRWALVFPTLSEQQHYCIMIVPGGSRVAQARDDGTGPRLATRAPLRRLGDRRLVAEAIDRLIDDGPSLGRPLVDRIAGSRLHNLKELRPGSSGASEVRILFIFDPVRNAVLLIAGDKSGRWKEWYAEAIPAAEAAYEAYLEGRR